MLQVGKNTVFYSSEINHAIECVDVTLVNFGLQGKDAYHTHGPTTKDEHVIQYVFNGEGIFIVDGKTYNIKKNDLFYLPKNEVVKYFSNANNPYSYYWMGFDGKGAERIISAIGLNKDSPIKHVDDVGVTDAFESLKSAVLKNSTSSVLMANSLMLKLFSLLITDDEQSNKTIKNVSDEYVNKALYFIRENFGKDINVTDIADVVGLKRNYFDVIFKSRVGVSPIKYLINYRIEQAKIMLSLDMTVTETAINCGFNSPSNFGAKFKKFTGLTPFNFKKRTKFSS